MKAQIQELSEQLQAAFIAYDEGLQSDDTVLAGAIWRRIYQHKYASPYHLEAIVKYIRKHVRKMLFITYCVLWPKPNRHLFVSFVLMMFKRF